MRINGFSGMDIDQMVSQLMKARRMPLDTMKQKKQMLEWQRDDYRTMYSKILDLRNKAFDMKLQGSYLSKKATSSSEQNVKVTGTNEAAEGNYTIRIDTLAASASAKSNASVTPVGTTPKSTNTMEAIGLTAAESTLTIGGEKGTATIVVRKTDTIDEFVKGINNKSNITGVKVTYDETLDRFFFVSSSTGVNSRIDLKSTDAALLTDVLEVAGSSSVPAKGETVTGTVDFTSGTFNGTATLIDNTLTGNKKVTISYGGQPYEFTIAKSTTVGQLIDSINSSGLGKAGVSAYLDKDGYLAFFNEDDDPAANELSFSDDDSGNMLTKLGLPSGVPSTGVTGDQNYEHYEISGTNADIIFNGAPGSYASNTFTIGGMSFAALKADPATTVNVSITQDTDAVYNSIKSFVDKYNEIISEVNKELAEERDRNYLPLTEEQKDAMSEDDIKRWEEKAKSGQLRRDSILSSGLFNFRGALVETVTGFAAGKLKSLSDIGISSSLVIGNSISGNFTEEGKLYINDADLRAAIANKPDEVMSLFTANDGDRTSDDGDGIAVRIYDIADNLMGKLNNKAGNSFSLLDDYAIGKGIKNIDKRISNFESKLMDMEERYYRQFTAMEKALSQLNSQSSWLSQQFAQ